MSLERFEEHLRDPAPGFRCFDCDDLDEKPVLLVRVSNHVGQPASEDVMTLVAGICGRAAPALQRFARLHDGVLLYLDSKSDAAGVRFFKAAEWRARTEEMRRDMACIGFEGPEMPVWFQRGIVFGEIPQSGNYLVVQLEGDEAGQIFYCDHDGFTEEALAASFEALLAMIMDDPSGFMDERGCYTRYSDGASDIQWIPKEYVPDCLAV